jgi:hypothetical protein
MAETIASLYEQLQADPWRTSFSPEVEDAHRALFRSPEDAVRAGIINDWLASKNQPCLFARTAAKRGLLSFCVLTEQDLSGPDVELRQKLQSKRLAWLRRGFQGHSSGFVIVAITERLAYAAPSQTILQLAQRLCSLYLMRSIAPDTIYHDEIFLEKPGPGRRTWRWLVGANFFGAQGDGRWWRDHRIPGGIALSMNSVGHMVKADMISRAMMELDRKVGAVGEEWDVSQVDSLDKALTLAMRTIKQAADTPSGPATSLITDDGSCEIACPFPLPPDLAGRSYCEYRGQYHTDVTLPSEYFDPAVNRPASVPSHVLDFTYLFDRRTENQDFVLMGEGVPIRDAERPEAVRQLRRFRSVEQELDVDEAPLLRQALAFREQPGS